jgi:hypothetical protein
MEQPTVTQAVLALAPNAEFSLDTDGDGNWTITNWYSDDIDQPSNSDIETKLTQLQAEYDAKDWERNRQAEYPSLEDCIHALLDGGDTLTDLQAARQAVKDNNPKP